MSRWQTITSDHTPWQRIIGRECTIGLAKRPDYCDRGNFVATLDAWGKLGAEIDMADGFPRYYFDETRAKLEMEAWLRTRRQWIDEPPSEAPPAPAPSMQEEKTGRRQRPVGPFDAVPDTLNRFAVTAHEGRVVSLARGFNLTREEAVNLAAWLLVGVELASDVKVDAVDDCVKLVNAIYDC